jgi:hypothetical protein
MSAGMIEKMVLSSKRLARPAKRAMATVAGHPGSTADSSVLE